METINQRSQKARAEILKRLTAVAHPASHPLMESSIEAPKPTVPEDLTERLSHFIVRATQLDASVECVTDDSKIIPAIEHYCRQHCPQAQRVVIAPECQHLPFSQAAWVALQKAAFREANGDDEIGISGAFCAIADTGTLMLISGENTPSSVSLLPETHIAILAANRIVRHMEDAWALYQKEWGALPRAVNFVSGPSRTGDIEQTIVLGAHGPMRVHLIIVGSPTYQTDTK